MYYSQWIFMLVKCLLSHCSLPQSSMAVGTLVWKNDASSDSQNQKGMGYFMISCISASGAGHISNQNPAVYAELKQHMDEARERRVSRPLPCIWKLVSGESGCCPFAGIVAGSTQADPSCFRCWRSMAWRRSGLTKTSAWPWRVKTRTALMLWTPLRDPPLST